jgi:hypothetical protein
MTLGSRLGPYEIAELVCAGGMGGVWTDVRRVKTFLPCPSGEVQAITDSFELEAPVLFNLQVHSNQGRTWLKPKADGIAIYATAVCHAASIFSASIFSSRRMSFAG